MTLQELDVRLPAGPVQLLNPQNQAFLAGTAEPQLSGAHPLHLWFGRLLTGGSVALLVMMVAFVVVMEGWASSLAQTVDATVDQAHGDETTYTYVVDGVSYTATERSRRSFSAGDTAEVRVLDAVPSWSMLAINVEPTDWFTFVGVLVFLGAGVYGGRLASAEARMLRRLAKRATHVLLGTLVLEIPGLKGSRTYVYEFPSPSSGEMVRGNVMVGAMVRFEVPSSTAVLYADDQTHQLL